MYYLFCLSSLLKIMCCATAIFFLTILHGCACVCVPVCMRVCVRVGVLVLSCCARRVGYMGAWVGLWI